MLAPLLLIVAASFYRLCYAFAGSPPHWANFSPLAAILLCSAASFPRKITFLLALLPLLVADLVLNAHYHAPLIDTGITARYFSFGLIVLLGFCLYKQRYFKTLFLIPSALASSFLFFLITNTASWFTTLGYPKTFPGWCQALTTGLPGFPPTLLFFRNTILSDLFFTVLFVVAQIIFKPSHERIAKTVPPAVRI